MIFPLFGRKVGVVPSGKRTLCVTIVICDGSVAPHLLYIIEYLNVLAFGAFAGVGRPHFSV